MIHKRLGTVCLVAYRARLPHLFAERPRTHDEQTTTESRRRSSGPACPLSLSRGGTPASLWQPLAGLLWPGGRVRAFPGARGSKIDLLSRGQSRRGSPRGSPVRARGRRNGHAPLPRLLPPPPLAGAVLSGPSRLPA